MKLWSLCCEPTLRDLRVALDHTTPGEPTITDGEVTIDDLVIRFDGGRLSGVLRDGRLQTPAAVREEAASARAVVRVLDRLGDRGAVEAG